MHFHPLPLSLPRRFQRSGALVLSGLLLSTALASEPDNPLNILYPSNNSRHWVKQLEFSGYTAPGNQVWVNDTLIKVDSTGLIRKVVTLAAGKNILHIQVQSKTVSRDTSLTLWRMLPDHLDPDGRFVNNNLADTLWLQVLSPRPGELNTSQISFNGWTRPDAILFLNGDTLPVWPSGGFTGLLMLDPGINQYIFQAKWQNQSISDTLTLVRPPPPAPDENHYFTSGTQLPADERWISKDDVVAVGFDGKPGQRAFYQLPGSTAWIALDEVSPGVYRDTWLVINIPTQKAFRIRYMVKHHRFLSAYSLAVAPIRMLATPLGGLTIDPDTRIYHQLGDGLFMPLQAGISLKIVGREKDYYKVWLSADLQGYVQRRKVKLLPRPQILSPLRVGPLHGENVGDWQRFRMDVGPIHPPFTLNEVYGPDRLELTLYGAEQGWEWTTFPHPEGDIAYLERKQLSNQIWQMNFYSKRGQFWGWRGYYAGDYFVVDIRKPPVIKPDSLFNHISIEIDPGHGGYERGAIGVTGYAEADANLRYSLKLAQRLRAAGAAVYLTRTIDKRLSLPERAEIARNDSVQIFVMAHNNAPGETSDPLASQGTSTYFTWPGAKPLCDATYPHLLDLGLNDYGKITRYYYYLLRQTDYLVFLVEGAFMTNPADEMFLLSDEGLDRLAGAVFRGIHDFLQEQSLGQTN